jgi:hypothetical protein
LQLHGLRLKKRQRRPELLRRQALCDTNGFDGADLLKGDLVIDLAVKDPDELKIGDIITFGP